MTDEVTINVDDTEAQIAAGDAERAADDARVAAAAAMGATVAQGQLIGQVMEHAREDARESAADAEQASDEAESAAAVAVEVNAITAEMYQDLLKRIEALEQKEEEPVEVAPAEPEVTEIGGEEQPTQEPPPEQSGQPAESRPSRPSTKRHGRKGR